MQESELETWYTFLVIILFNLFICIVHIIGSSCTEAELGLYQQPLYIKLVVK